MKISEYIELTEYMNKVYESNNFGEVELFLEEIFDAIKTADDLIKTTHIVNELTEKYYNDIKEGAFEGVVDLDDPLFIRMTRGLFKFVKDHRFNKKVKKLQKTKRKCKKLCRSLEKFEREACITSCTIEQLRQAQLLIKELYMKHCKKIKDISERECKDMGNLQLRKIDQQIKMLKIRETHLHRELNKEDDERELELTARRHDDRIRI